MKRAFATVVLLCACAAPVGRDSIEGSADIESQFFAPQTVESSAPAWPTWLRDAGHGRPSENGFVGQAEGPTMEAAKALAMRDLYSALSSYLSVDVSTEQDDQMVETNGASSQSVREVVRARSAAQLQGIAADASYWERVVTSPLSPEIGRYRYFVRARLKKSDIERSRRAQSTTRRSKTARQMVVILPFEAALEVDAKAKILAAGLADDLGVELANRPEMFVGDPGAVRAVLAGGAYGADEQLERVQEALSPDVVITGLVQRDGGRVRATLVLHDGLDGRPRGTRTIERVYASVPSLPRSLADVIAADLAQVGEAPQGVSRSQKVDPGASVEALEAYHGALAAFQAGDNERALELIHRALVLRPDDGLAYLRLGRILERLGRYGKLPPSQAVLQQRSTDLAICSVSAQTAVARAETFLKSRAAALRKDGPIVTDREPPFLDVDVGLNSVIFRTIDDQALSAVMGEQLSLGHMHPCVMNANCPLQVRAPELIDSALEAYLAARARFEVAAEDRRTAEVDLAIAGVARRVDRLDQAYTLYAKVAEWAFRTQALDLVGDALAGQAAVLRSLGNLEAARELLEQALAQRAVLGEKPQLLELHNDLGGVLVELGDAPRAERHFRKAWRLSIELGNEYLQAVLLNNIGVLELRQGKIASAAQHVERAFTFLSNVGEIEGRSASGLNLGILATLAGDPERATEAYDRVGRLIERTTQEGWLGQVGAKRGALLASQGDPESLYHLGMAALIFRGLGRSAQAERIANNLLVAELESPDRDRALYDCLKERYWSLGAPSFWMASADPSTVTLAELPPEALQEQELVTALNAASIAGLSAWSPDHLIVHQRPPPRFATVLRPPGLQIPRPPPHSRPERLDAQPEPARPSEELQTMSEPTSTEGTIGDWRPEPPSTVAPTVVTKAAAQERIVGTFTADADLYVLLDPALLEEAYQPRAAAWALPMLGGALRIAEAKGAVKAHAVALLNLGAYEWHGRRAETAYALMMGAHRVFSETGDLYGLAHTYEWLGFFFRESGDIEKAGQNLGIAYRLYLEVGHRAAAERVLGYSR